jgi:glycogen debranching enzyme
LVQCVEGPTFMLSDAVGDVHEDSPAGLFHEDTRHLSRFVLTLDRRPLVLLRSQQVDYYSAAFYCTNDELDGVPRQSLSIKRHRLVGAGLLERITLDNHLSRELRLELRLECAADFASVFEAHEGTLQAAGRAAAALHDGVVTFTLDDTAFHAATVLRSTAGPRFELESALQRAARRFRHAAGAHADVVYDVHLEPHGCWQAEVQLELQLANRQLELIEEDIGDDEREPARVEQRWDRTVPVLRSDSCELRRIHDQSVRELGSLRFHCRLGGVEAWLPAGGMPWFMAVFGRDTILTAYQAIAVAPELARGTLEMLSALQAEGFDAARDMEPGKILHEVRFGRLTAQGDKPYAPYFGTCDATQLFLVLLSEHWRFSGDDSLCHRLRGNVMRALEWIDAHGDRDRDGYVEYERRTDEGIRNQCWKDSHDAIVFADGTMAGTPIAICEAQGYTYDAKLRIAEIAETVWGDTALAARLRTEAQSLYQRFNDDFWIGDERDGHYALGLDGDKRRIDSRTSNMGQLLWSGIVPPDRARVVARHLMSAAMYSGFGVRSLAAGQAAYSPISYHRGTVWPHDNALIAAGLAAYGFRDESGRIALDMFDAAAGMGDGLPEVFAGYDRAETRFPVSYPAAGRPQAWAAAAPLLLLRTLLGLRVRALRPQLDPALPEGLGRVSIRGVHVGGRRWTVEAAGSDGAIEEIPDGGS